jgi:hypothetical protein
MVLGHFFVRDRCRSVTSFLWLIVFYSITFPLPAFSRSCRVLRKFQFSMASIWFSLVHTSGVSSYGMNPENVTIERLYSFNLYTHSMSFPI